MFKKLINKLFKTPDVISFKAGFDLTDLPVVTFHQGDKRFNFLLDTGSNCNIIDKNILSEIKSKPVQSNDTLFGLEGHKTAVDKCEITLYFNDKGYTYDYIINDMSEPFGHLKADNGVTLHGILGSRFFNKFKYVLDFEKLIAYSKM